MQVSQVDQDAQHRLQVGAASRTALHLLPQARRDGPHHLDIGLVHALEELGVDPGELPSPVVAAGASLAAFAVGAVIPLIPYLAGLHLMVLALGFAAVAAIGGGGMVARLTDRPFWRGAVRQLILGAGAVAITYLIGVGVGHVAA